VNADFSGAFRLHPRIIVLVHTVFAITSDHRQNHELVRLLDRGSRREIHRIWSRDAPLAKNASTLHLGASILARSESHVARARFANVVSAFRPVLCR